MSRYVAVTGTRRDTRHKCGALIVELWNDSGLDSDPDVHAEAATLAEAINAALDSAERAERGEHG